MRFAARTALAVAVPVMPALLLAAWVLLERADWSRHSDLCEWGLQTLTFDAA